MIRVTQRNINTMRRPATPDDKMEGKKTKELEQRVLEYILQNQIMKSGQKILTGVSGGADSVAMLHILWRLKETLGIQLHIAHLNHQLRGAESEADAAFVADLAKQWRIPISLQQANVKGFQSEHHLSLEEAAREVRYAFLAEIAELEGAAAVAVGHNQNDQIETILLHIIRGSGTQGLQGLKAAHNLQAGERQVRVIRPLLEVNRSEIEQYCRRYGLNYRQDSTNLTTEMLRNRVRLELLPLLKNYNPDIAGALLRTSRIARDEIAFLEQESSRIWEQITTFSYGNIVIDKGAFLCLPVALQRQIVRRAIQELRGNLKDIETRHIETILNARQKPAGRQIHLPENYVFSVEYSRYIIGKDITLLVPFPELEGNQALQVPGLTHLPGWEIEAKLQPVSDEYLDVESRENWQNNGFSADFDFNTTGEKLFIRSLQPGDTFFPLGLGKHKKVARFMLDARIPHDWRRRVPLVCNEQQIIWVAGWRIDERAKVSAQTRSVLRLKMSRE
jgi:tRNA(Ile)-lysidine synthase